MMVMIILLMMQPRMITKAQSSNQEKQDRRSKQKTSVTPDWKEILVLIRQLYRACIMPLKLIYTSCNAIKVMLIAQAFHLVLLWCTAKTRKEKDCNHRNAEPAP
jgi:hypothetical protein